MSIVPIGASITDGMDANHGFPFNAEGRGVPSKPIEISSSGDIKKYRYNLSGEPVHEQILTDANAVKEGYISISILDYDLDQESLRENLKPFFNE